jgi:hypothetical protein
MLSTLARRVDARASWRGVGILLVCYAALVAALGKAEAQIKAYSGGLGVPDLMQGFTSAELYDRLEAFRPEGRRIYLQAELVDMVYPAVYATFFAFLLALVARTLREEASRLRAICLLPYAAMIADYLENACFFTVLLSWPARHEAVAAAGGVFNLSKWAAFGITLPLVVVGLVAMGIRALRREPRGA